MLDGIAGAAGAFTGFGGGGGFGKGPAKLPGMAPAARLGYAGGFA
jgi:hypothetical protein